MRLHRFEPIARLAVHVLARASRGLTIGVRGLVLNAAGEALLVKHTYVRGWHMPGGGLERGETAEQALARELVEEAGVRLTARPELVSVHTNHRQFPGDHVLFYRIPAWEPCAATSRGEIAERAWFALDRLPPDVSEATRRRIDEAQDGAPPHPDW